MFQNEYLRITLVVSITLVCAFILSSIFRFIINKYLKKKSADMNVDPTNYVFIKNASSFIILIIAIVVIFVSIPSLKAIGLSLFAGAGLLAAIIGFASQQAFANIVSGIFIVLYKPLRVGDYIELDIGQSGIVEDITLRHTVIRNFENRRIIVPNATIGSATIKNSSITEEKVCMHIEMGVSYDTNIDLAMQIMHDVICSHKFNIDNRTDADRQAGVNRVITRVVGFGDSSVNIRAWAWAVGPLEGWYMKCDVFKKIKEEFDAKGVEIPFPYRTIVYKKDITSSAE